MATLLPDIIEGSEFINEVGAISCTRVFTVMDIDVQATGFDPNVLVKALAMSGMPQLNDSHPSIGNCPLRRHIVRGQSNNQAKILAQYESPQLGISLPPAGTFLVRDSTILATERVQLGPHARPLKVIYGGLTSSQRIDQLVSMDRLTPMRSLLIAGLIQANPTQMDNFRESVGKVNDRTWAGKAKGFWLCSQFESDTFDLGKTYQVNAAFTTRQYRNWMNYGWYFDALGHVPQQSLSGEQEIQNLMAQEYGFEIRQTGIGFMTAGLYEMFNFAAVFGNI